MSLSPPVSGPPGPGRLRTDAHGQAATHGGAASGTGHRGVSSAVSSPQRDRRDQQRAQTSHGPGPSAGAGPASGLHGDLSESGRLEHPAGLIWVDARFEQKVLGVGSVLFLAVRHFG